MAAELGLNKIPLFGAGLPGAEPPPPHDAAAAAAARREQYEIRVILNDVLTSPADKP